MLPRLSDPNIFPHRLSFDDGLISFLPTNQVKLRAATFLDNRADFATGKQFAVAIGDVLAQPPGYVGPDRFIFHISFCGSTLLSRLLDSSGRAMVLREPQSLSDLASRFALMDQRGGEDAATARMLTSMSALLGRQWRSDEPVIVKPSNWANNLIPRLVVGGRLIRPVFMTMAIRDFMLAVFRGGRERIAFTARACVHLSHMDVDYADLVARALAGGDEEDVKLARLVALIHHIQTGIFRRAAQVGGWGEEHWISFDMVERSPAEAAAKAAAALAVDVPAKAIAMNVIQWAEADAKAPTHVYSLKDRAAENRVVEAHFGALIDRALQWLEDVASDVAVRP